MRYLTEAKRRENKGAPEDLRFTAESLGIATRYHYFDYFCDRDHTKLETVTETIGALDSVVRLSEKEANPAIKHWVLRQSLTNYFTLQLMLEDARQIRHSHSEDRIRENLSTLRTVLGDSVRGKRPEDDPYAHLVCNIATAIWEPDAQVREKAKERAFEAVSIVNSWHTPYDEERMNMLRRVIPARRRQTP